MDIKIIISMFEDLKKLTSEQFSNLSKLVESMANAKSDQPVLPIIPQADLSELENHVTETNEFIKEGFQNQQEQLHEFQQKLEKQKDKPLPVQKHLHSIELKSSLETIFEYKPDKQKQHSIRRMVEEHEQRVEQRARDLEQARLKEAQAEQLRQEADKIKQKK